MALDEYRSKRDFTRSPEPPGREPHARKRRQLFFCVQKHLASHLHYDFRLEYRGVLLSWAVPKGPSLDPATKRLAMKVEDHPFEYGTFEGVIPEGYGAGIVMLWDQGTWEPETADIDAALAKGELKFRLDGYKLKGSWVIVRTKRPGTEGKDWLLIKHKDEWAGPVDIAEFAPYSVKSNGDFVDILAQERPDFWQSGRPAAAGQPGSQLQKAVERAVAMREERERNESARSEAGPRPAKSPRRASSARARTTRPRAAKQPASATRQGRRSRP